MEPLKVNFIHSLQLLASTSEQDRYQSEVNVDIGDELICIWSYGKGERERLAKFLSPAEIKKVDEFHDFFESSYRMLPGSYVELRESELWHQVMQRAKETLTACGWDKVQTVWGSGAV